MIYYNLRLIKIENIKNIFVIYFNKKYDQESK